MQRRYVSVDGNAFRVFSIGFGVGDTRDLAPGLVAFGGERRVATLARFEGSMPPFDAARFKDVRRLKVVLLTPGVFTEGAVPKKFYTPDGDPSVVAAIVARPEVLSGWDFEKACPKPTRRVVSPGAVYWLDVVGLDASKVAKHLWFRSISSSIQDRTDGYGLAVVFPDTNSHIVTG
jgi:CRISPR-associated protein Cmr3